MEDDVGLRPRRTRLLALGFFAVIAALSVLWALASPIFSVPDENAHATKAVAQVRGQIFGYSKEGERHKVVDLPESYRYNQSILCYALHPDVTASCHTELGDPIGTDYFGTWVGSYNPLYYYLVGWPSLFFDGTAGIYAMRVVSALLGAALLGWAFQLALSRSRRPWLPLALAFGAMPMVLYFFGSVNPQGLEVAAGVTLWVGLLRLFEAYSSSEPVRMRAPWPVWTAVTVSALILANVRALGPLWVVLLVAMVAFASGWPATKTLFTTGSSYGWIAVVAAGGIFSLVWTQSGGSLSGQALASDAPLVGASFLTAFAYMIRTTPDFLHEVFGYFGWFDAVPPGWSYWLIAGVLTLVLVLGFTAVRRRNVLVLAVALAAALLVPALVQGYSAHQTGVIWQGRYFLFFYLGVVILAAWGLSSEGAQRVAFLARRITWVGASMLAVFGIVVFFFILRRYVVGAEHPIGQMWKNPGWQPPLTWAVLLVLYVLFSAAFVAIVGMAVDRRLPVMAAQAGPAAVGRD